VLTAGPHTMKYALALLVFVLASAVATRPTDGSTRGCVYAPLVLDIRLDIPPYFKRAFSASWPPGAISPQPQPQQCKKGQRRKKDNPSAEGPL
jgi:hypothetical protein